MKNLKHAVTCCIGVGLLLIQSTSSCQQVEDARSGAYATSVELNRSTNTCGNVTVRDNITTVEYAKETKHFSLTHAGITYNGTVSSDGQFKTEPKTVDGSDSEFRIVIEGKFNERGFVATVTIQVSKKSAPATCSYEVKWTGIRNAGQ